MLGMVSQAAQQFSATTPDAAAFDQGDKRKAFHSGGVVAETISLSHRNVEPCHLYSNRPGFDQYGFDKGENDDILCFNTVTTKNTRFRCKKLRNWRFSGKFAIVNVHNFECVSPKFS